ncbi:membrane associated rhomboid family serine protease [Anseongella ginsenosidimutans]|uniref:Membrane associated rhomboid family serine protease n=1 Tax=Anseongella ginsenosidimutans TaxID=496056 RepID=A0A4R3KWJ1_9SPHI|nr:rhomboid family intramembrane serine protease [Anseongella ginsenosidimutans]QEC51733.1 rhomboid family intramembrane serine protease [Anseongella ginsenosidimutans]TCS89096.1 membrane associated rhomboid family serine protease [Anseongella ginsenosidimutans]
MQEVLQAAPVAVIIFIFTLITSFYGLYVNQNLNHQFMLHPYSFVRKERLYTIITSGLIHADFGHLLFNMLTFFFFAFRLEAMIGSWEFALLYIGGLILSDIPTIIKHRNNSGYASLGASGAISAVLFSYILFDPTTKLFLFFIPIGIPAYIFGPLYLVYCVYASRNQHDRVNHDAHFYGALTGILFTVLLTPGIIPHFVNQLTS